MQVKDSTIETQAQMRSMNLKGRDLEVTVISECIKLCPAIVKIVIGTRITSRLIYHGTETRK